MDLASIATRALAAYLFLLALLRLAGKRSIRQGTTFDFVLALVLGDLIDDAMRREGGLWKVDALPAIQEHPNE